MGEFKEEGEQNTSPEYNFERVKALEATLVKLLPELEQQGFKPKEIELAFQIVADTIKATGDIYENVTLPDSPAVQPTGAAEASPEPARIEENRVAQIQAAYERLRAAGAFQVSNEAASLGMKSVQFGLRAKYIPLIERQRADYQIALRNQGGGFLQTPDEYLLPNPAVNYRGDLILDLEGIYSWTNQLSAQDIERSNQGVYIKRIITPARLEKMSDTQSRIIEKGVVELELR